MSNIFVVDDSISVRKALELALKKEGHHVRTAASAEAALEHIGQEPVDLVIADVIMPGLSGFDLCRRLKTDPEYAQYSDIPLLIISGNVDDEVHRQDREAGAVDVLKKPFKHDDLMEPVQKALQSRPAPAAPAVPAAAPAVPEVAAAPFAPAAPEVMVNPPATEARPQSHGGAFTAMVDRAAKAPGVLGAVLVERDGAVLERRGEPLPDKIGQYARFYMGTAEFLAGQVGESGAGPLELELGSKRLTIRPLGDKFLITLGRL